MNIFVYGINFKARKDDLIELFSQYGEVTAARIILDKETHRSKGYGFVEMSQEDGMKAIAAVEGMEHMDRIIHAAPAKERPEDAQ